MDPLSICASAANVAQLCGTIIHKLWRFCEATSHVDITVAGFRVEIRNFQMALRLVAEIQQKLPSRPLQDIETDHWRLINRLLDRCRQTLDRLDKLLTESEAKQTVGRTPITQLRLNMRSHIICILRSHIKSYTQALQVSLQTTTLVTQWQNNASIEHELHELAGAIQDVKESLSTRQMVGEVDDIDEEATERDLQEEQGIKADVEQIISSAAVVEEVTKTSIYQPDMESVAGRRELMNEPISNWMSETRAALPRRDTQITGGIPLPITPDFESIPPTTGRLDDSGIGSDTASDFDPDPDIEDHFSASMIEKLVEKFKRQVNEEFEAGHYSRAENAQLMMMKYLDEGQKKHGMAYDDAEAYERLAQIYHKQRRLDEAKDIYHSLLSKPREKTADDWRWYYSLARICQDQDKLQSAEKWAKRAFTGREKSLPEGDPLIVESVALLAQISQQLGSHTVAEVLLEKYFGDVPRNLSIRASRDSSSLLEISSGGSGISWLEQAGYDVTSPNFAPREALRDAIKEDHEAAVDAVLQQIRDGKKRSDYAKDGLKWAIQYGRCTIARNLLELDFGIGKDERLSDGQTPLIQAIRAKKGDIVQEFLQRGASPEIRCSKGMTPLVHAVEAGQEAIAAILLSKGAWVDATTYGWTALHKAIDLRDDGMVKLLLANDAGIELCGPRKWSAASSTSSSADCSWTALLMAAQGGSSHIAHSLIEKVANIEARTATGATPLMYAAEEKHTSMVRLLLAANADVHASDKKGDTALHRVARKSRSPETIDLLFGKGVNIDAANLAGETALHIAASRSGGERLLSSLLDRQANIEATDVSGATPLHVAIEKRQENSVKILLERGANIDAVNHDGHNATKVAQSRSCPEIQILLKRHKKQRSNTGTTTMSRRGSAQSASTATADVGRGRSPSITTASSRFSFLGKLGSK